MDKLSSKKMGTCLHCGDAFSSRAITRHVCACKQAERGTEPALLLVIEHRWNKSFWLRVEVAESAPLARLDACLRDIWLECCGHLSSFSVGKRTYSSPSAYDDGWGEPEESMDTPIGDALQAGDRFSYLYDYGSSTELAGRVVRAIADGVPEPSVRVVARNTAPSERCKCGQPVTEICTRCDGELLCEACRDKNHSGDCEGMSLPFVNSPRAGVCGYSG